MNTKDGDKRFFGTAILNDRLKSVALGTLVKVVYRGKVQGKKNQYHDFDVFVSKQNPGVVS